MSSRLSASSLTSAPPSTSPSYTASLSNFYATLTVGTPVDCWDIHEAGWRKAEVVRIRQLNANQQPDYMQKEFLVRWKGWETKWDEWNCCSSNRLAPYNTRTSTLLDTGYKAPSSSSSTQYNNNKQDEVSWKQVATDWDTARQQHIACDLLLLPFKTKEPNGETVKVLQRVVESVDELCMSSEISSLLVAHRLMLKLRCPSLLDLSHSLCITLNRQQFESLCVELKQQKKEEDDVMTEFESQLSTASTTRHSPSLTSVSRLSSTTRSSSSLSMAAVNECKSNNGLTQFNLQSEQQNEQQGDKIIVNYQLIPVFGVDNATHLNTVLQYLYTGDLLTDSVENAVDCVSVARLAERLQLQRCVDLCVLQMYRILTHYNILDALQLCLQWQQQQQQPQTQQSIPSHFQMQPFNAHPVENRCLMLRVCLDYMMFHWELVWSCERNVRQFNEWTMEFQQSMMKLLPFRTIHLQSFTAAYPAVHPSHNTLIHDLRQLYEMHRNGDSHVADSADFRIRIVEADGENEFVFEVSHVVLTVRSEYFRALFRCSFNQQSNNNEMLIDSQQLNTAALKCLLKHLYYGSLKVSAEAAVYLSNCSDFFGLSSSLLEQQCLDSVSQEHCCQMLLMSWQLKNTALFRRAVKFCDWHTLATIIQQLKGESVGNQQFQATSAELQLIALSAMQQDNFQCNYESPVGVLNSPQSRNNQIANSSSSNLSCVSQDSPLSVVCADDLIRAIVVEKAFPHRNTAKRNQQQTEQQVINKRARS